MNSWQNENKKESGYKDFAYILVKMQNFNIVMKRDWQNKETQGMNQKTYTKMT